MQNDFDELAKKAVKAAIASNWPLAKSFNLQILDQDPDNVEAKTRFGKALLELGEYAKAKKYFKEVLSADPINTVALKNLELAKECKHSNGATNGYYKNIIKEPATYAETQAEITAKGFTASKIPMGADLEIKVLTQQSKIIYSYKGQKTELAVIKDPKIQRQLKAGKAQKGSITATFVKGVDKTITILLNSSLPIFDSEKQELKPYTKHDFLDSDNEPEPSLDENQL